MNLLLMGRFKKILFHITFSNMNLLIYVLFGFLGTVCAVYKIPEYDACVLRVLLCDDFTKPLTPVDNSTLEMFQSIGQLNAVCDKLSKFRVCLENAEKFCTENAKLNVGFDLLKNRRSAFDLCVRGSAHQHVYMMVEGCVNKYSHSAIEFCTDRAVETVGLDFYLGDYESECRYLGAIQHCHIAVITDLCGSIAGNMLEKLVVFRGERDFMCLGYEKERKKNIEAFYATMDSYVQQYRNTVYKNEDKAEIIDEGKIDETRQESSKEFHSRISPSPYFSEKYRRTHKPLDENIACRVKAAFLLMGIRKNGEYYQLGYGEADIIWDTFSPLTDLFCLWFENHQSPPTEGYKCVILIDTKIKIIGKCDYPLHTVCVFELENNRVPTRLAEKRKAELRLYSFFKPSSSLDRSLDNVFNFFKTHAHDIRLWCSDRHEDNLYKEQNKVHSTSRIGFVPSDVHEYGVVNRPSEVSGQKYNFYKPERSEYAIDTEIHLISSGDTNFGDEFKVGDTYSTESYDENLNPLFNDEILTEEDSYQYFTPRPFKPLESKYHSYRPYELYRPRVGEIPLAQKQDISNHDIGYIGMQNAAESNPNPNVLSLECDTDNCYSRNQFPVDVCPGLPENVSKLVRKPRRDLEINYMNMDDPLSIVESNRYKKFSISETKKDIPESHVISKANDPENIIATSNKENQYNEIYIVTQSTEMVESTKPDRMVYKHADLQDLDEIPQILSTEDDNQDLVEIPQESDFKESTLEKSISKSANVRSLRRDYLELSHDNENKHSFSSKFRDVSTDQEVAPEEQVLHESKFLSRRLGPKCAIEMGIEEPGYCEKNLDLLLKNLHELKMGLLEIARMNKKMEENIKL